MPIHKMLVSGGHGMALYVSYFLLTSWSCKYPISKAIPTFWFPSMILYNIYTIQTTVIVPQEGPMHFTIKTITYENIMIFCVIGMAAGGGSDISVSSRTNSSSANSYRRVYEEQEDSHCVTLATSGTFVCSHSIEIVGTTIEERGSGPPKKRFLCKIKTRDTEKTRQTLEQVQFMNQTRYLVFIKHMPC